jgi:hypothetical protein
MLRFRSPGAIRFGDRILVATPATTREALERSVLREMPWHLWRRYNAAAVSWNRERSHAKVG